MAHTNIANTRGAWSVSVFGRQSCRGPGELVPERYKSLCYLSESRRLRCPNDPRGPHFSRATRRPKSSEPVTQSMGPVRLAHSFRCAQISAHQSNEAPHTGRQRTSLHAKEPVALLWWSAIFDVETGFQGGRKEYN